MTDIVIIGAGAIGRGYLPWLFAPDAYNMVFVDRDVSVIERLHAKRGYTTYRVRHHALESRFVKVAQAYTPDAFVAQAQAHRNAQAVFINVGPRNVLAAAQLVEGFAGPVILSENDPGTVDQVKGTTALKSVFFAVPDVIASSTAPPDLLQKDPLSTVTEDGTMFIDGRVQGLQGTFEPCTVTELQRQWTAKLYLHNTPHCVAAYLGALAGCRYLHEAMQIADIKTVVEGVMAELLRALQAKWDMAKSFLEWYAHKELARFASPLLYDPIARVAREPLRKLEVDGRLLGAAQICLSLGIVPENILLGITAAMLFDNADDPDRHLSFMRRALRPTTFLTHVLQLRRGEALERVICDRLEMFMTRLQAITAARLGEQAS